MRCFRDYQRICRRLHFFKKTFTKEEFLNHLKDDQSSFLQDNYLGFIVAKPLPDSIIGRTILETYPRKDTGRKFPTIKWYNTNLFGRNLKIKSLAFQEQDTVTAACATCALWVAFQKTADLFDRSWSPTPIEITKAATKFQIKERPIPSSGLNIGQISRAIEEVGLEPQIVDISEITENQRFIPIQSLIYSYLEMGIPVLLGGTFQSGSKVNHVVTITGYHLSNKPFVKREVPNYKSVEYCPLKGRKIDKFYAHDDAVGPFSKMLIGTRVKNTITLFNDPDVDYEMWKKIYPEMIVIPLYEKIRIPFQSVYEWVLKINFFLESVLIIKNEELEWDIHLEETKVYKNKILMDKNRQSSKVIFENLPRYIWICNATGDENKPLFEIIADATDIPNAFFLIKMIFFDEAFEKKLKDRMKEKLVRKNCKNKLTENFMKLIDGSLN